MFILVKSAYFIFIPAEGKKHAQESVKKAINESFKAQLKDLLVKDSQEELEKLLSGFSEKIEDAFKDDYDGKPLKINKNKIKNSMGEFFTMN